MRQVGKLGAALLGLGLAIAALLWRDRRARDGASRLFDDARARLRASGLPVGLDRWRRESFRDIASQAPRAGDTPGELDLADENLTITQRVRTNLGREPALADVPHLNINTQEHGVVYLRGYVRSEEQRRLAESVAANTEGVSAVVNELNIERAVSM